LYDHGTNEPALQVFTTVSLTAFAYRRKRPLIYFCAPTPGQRSTVVLKEVERVSVSNFMPGNIIFDIVLVLPANLTVAHITQAYQLRPYRRNWRSSFSKRRSSESYWGSKSIPDMALNVWPFFERLRYCQTTFCRVP
jgi:hypothetical protein